MASDAPTAEFWFCLTHRAVEGVEGCPNKDRLGPYPSQAEASRALEKAAERTQAWDEDPDWNDDVEQPPAPGSDA